MAACIDSFNTPNKLVGLVNACSWLLVVLFKVVYGKQSNSTGFITSPFFELPSSREANLGAKIVLLLVGLNVTVTKPPSSVLRFLVYTKVGIYPVRVVLCFGFVSFFFFA